MRELGEHLDEVHLRAEIEDAEASLARRRRERTEAPRFGPGRLGRGSIVVPDLFGVSSLSAGGVGGLGGTGGLLFTGPISFGTRRTDDGSRATSLGFAPSFDAFVSDHLTIGGRIAAFRNTTTHVFPANDGAPAASTTSDGYTVGITPRVGYVIPLTDGLALWPQLGLGLSQSRYAIQGSGRTLSRQFGAELEVGLLVPLGKYVVARLAPTLAYSHVFDEDAGSSWLRSGGETIAAGVRAQIGLSF